MTQQQLGTVATVPQARTGPMPTAGRWGWYQDHEGNEFRRVSTLIKKVETDTFNLEKWKLRQVAEGLAIRDDLNLSIKAMGRPGPDGWSSDEKKKIDGIVDDAMRAAKQRDGARSGTAYHDLTERLDRGEDVESVVRGLPVEAARMLRAYAYLRRENGWHSVEIERTVVCDELECAGTFDRVDLIPGLAALLGPGECQYGHGPGDEHFGGYDDRPFEELPVVADVKTEAAPWLNGLHIGPQLGIYSRSRRMWRPTGGRVELRDRDGKPKTYPNSGDVIMIPAGEYVAAPCVRQDVAVVVHVHAGAATPYFINLREGWEAAEAAYAQINREARAKRALGRPGAWFAEVPGVKRAPAPTAAEVATAAAQVASDRGGQRCLVCQQAVQPGDENCRKCGNRVSLPAATAVAGAGVTQQSYRRPDGLVDWKPAGEAPIGTVATVAGVEFVKVDTTENVAQLGALDEVDQGAIRVIWQASTLEALAVVYDTYTGPQVGRPWSGRVAEAGAGRRKMIECVQRALHSGGGRCACGWDARFPA